MIINKNDIGKGYASLHVGFAVLVNVLVIKFNTSHACKLPAFNQTQHILR